jgi:hypothetical protein
METIYQGSAGVGLLNNWDINAIPLNIASDYATLDNIRRNAQNFKPYPQFGSIQLYSNFGHNSYHSATVKMERRYHSGLFVTGFYTFSKNLTDADADGSAGGATYYNRRLKRPVPIRHLTPLRGHVRYELPYGKGRKFATRAAKDFLIGGWNLMFRRHYGRSAHRMTYAGAPSTPFAWASLMCGLRVRRGRIKSPNDRADAELDDRWEPASNQRAESISERRRVRVSRAVYARHPGTQHAYVTRHHMGADFAVEDVEAEGADAFRNPLGPQ